MRRTYALFGEYKELVPQLATTLSRRCWTAGTGASADLIAQNITLRHQDRQRVLEELRPTRRLQMVNDILTHEVDMLSWRWRSSRRSASGWPGPEGHGPAGAGEGIQHELGDDGDEELAEYRRRSSRAHLPDEVQEKLTKGAGPPGQAALRQRGGLRHPQLSGRLPGAALEQDTRERADVEQARRLLDRDHYGLDKVKERILEFIAVQQLNPDAKGKILCLVGPPGVGKTSIAMSVAKAMNRKLARLSLGGVRDEADIRGHRKTYIGAMPGRIIDGHQPRRRYNPLLVLDEIDKLGQRYRGDPARLCWRCWTASRTPPSATIFWRCRWICPGDVHHYGQHHRHHPPALLDRMEVIELSSYTDEEKLQIAKRHLLPKQLKEHG